MRMISTLKNLLLTIFNTTNVELLPVAKLKSTSQNYIIPKMNTTKYLKHQSFGAFFSKSMLALLLLASPFFAFAQPTVLGTQLANGSYTTYDLVTRGGGVRFVRINATSGAGAGARNWEFATGTAGSTNYSTNWRPYTSGQQLSAYNTYVDPGGATGSARYNTGFGGQSGTLPAVVSGSYYTVIVGGNSVANNFMSILSTSYNPTSVSSVIQSPATTATAGQTVTLTVNMAASLNSGEYVYLRYSNDAFATSTILPVTMSGAIGTVVIPSSANTSGSTVSYYIFTSNQASAPSTTQADYFSLNIFNSSGQNVSGGGTNFSYTVTTITSGNAPLGNSPYTQNFNNLSGGLPSAVAANWSARTGASASALGTLATLNTSTISWATTTGQFQNSASANPPSASGDIAATQNGRIDRAFAVKTTGSFADPGQAFVFQIPTTSGKNGFNLSFKLMSLDAGTGRTQTWRVDYGIGAAPTSFTAVTTSPATITTGPTWGTTNVTATLPSAIDNQTGPVWIRITSLTASSGSGTRPCAAIDDFSLSWSLPSPPTITSFTVAAPGSGSSGYVGNVVTVNGTNFLSSGMTVKVGGSGGTTVSSYTFVNSTQITFPAPNAGGAIYIDNGTAPAASFGTYTNLGYITTTGATTWNTAASWLGGVVPVANSTATIAHALSIGAAFTNTPINSITVNTGITATASATVAIGTVTNAITTNGTGVFTFSGAGGSIIAGSVVNAGTLSWSANSNLNISAGGTLTNNGTFTRGTGTVTIVNAATINGSNAITFNNLTLTAGVATFTTIPTIDGTLSINGGNVSAAPRYTSNSTLFYGISYGRFNEWNATGIGTIGTTPGYPNNVTVNTGTLDVANGSTLARAMNGNLLVNAGGAFNLNAINAIVTVGGNLTTSGTGSVNMGTTNQRLNVGGAVNIAASGTLTLSSNVGGDIYVAGNFTNNSTFNHNTRAVFLNGAVQTISGSNLNTSGTTNCFDFLFIENGTNATLGANVSVRTNLTFTSGRITLSTFDLNLGTASITTPTSTSYVVTNNTGQLRQVVTTSAVLFPVGNSVYNPITFTNTGTSDTYGIRVADGNPPNAADPTSTVLRSWYITEATPGNSNLTPVVGQYNSGDVGTNYNAGVTPYMGFYNGSAWTQVATTLAGANPFTATSTGSAQFPATIPAGSYIVIGKDNAFISPASIAITNSAPASSNQNAGTTDVILQRLDFAVTVAGTTFNGLTVTTAGTYASADITNLKVRYSTDAILTGGDATLSTLTTPGAAGSKVFPSFTAQALAIGTYSIFITADIAAAATGGNTISLSSTAFSNISFTSGTKTGTDPVAASNTVTIVNPGIAISNSSPAASAHIQGSTDIVLNRFDFAVTSSNATLTGITVTTAGTYISADVVNLKVRYSANNILDVGDATLSTFTTPGVAGSKVFPSFTSQVITAGTTGYIFITADLSSTATPNNTISLASTAFSNLTFTLGNKTGTDPLIAGNTRTFIKAEPTNYPTAFTCGTTTATSIPLTWTDATGGILPDGYLIQWSSVGYGSITPPIDGTPVTDLANPTLGARNVAQGVGAYTITTVPALSSGTTYYMRIWSYTNSSTNINYRLLGEPQTSCATLTAPVNLWSNPITGTNPGLTNPYTTGDVVTGNLTVSGIGIGTGISGNAGNNRYNATNWNTSALDANDYFSFTLTPSAGFQINFSDFLYTGQASGTGPTSIAIRSSADSYTANIGTPTIAGTTISLSAAAYQNVNSSITFRVYAWGGSGGTFSINDFQFNGNVISVGTITTGTITGSPFCAGATGVNVPFTYTPPANFPIGTCTFTAQLSNASGSFGTPVNLQSVTSNASGSQSISVTIPSGTVTGLGYRIRVVSSTPTVTGAENLVNIIINNSATSIAPAATQNIATSVNGPTLTVTEGYTATSRQWKYGTAPGGPYGTNLGTAPTQIPNFAVANTYYIVCESTYPAPCSITVTSNEVQINVTTPVPEINVQGNSVNIADNDLTPSLTDHTEFSNVAWGATFTRTYTIQNTGTGTLNITLPLVIGGAQASDYAVTTPPSATIAPGGSSNFIVTFTPAAIGLRAASITINNDDSDEAIYNFNIQGTGTPSNLSTIEFNTSTTPQNIDYSLAANQVNDLISTSLAVMEFRIRDGGLTNTDADDLGTTLNAITLNITNWANLKRLALYNGLTEIAEAAVTGPTLTFSGLTGSEVTAPDNANRIITVRVSFQTTVTDNQQFSFSFANANVTALSTNSQFATFSTVNSETTADRNRIEVTADRLRFGTQPTNGSVNVNLAPFTIRFQDVNNNLDFDNNRTVTLATSGVNMSPVTPSVTITAPHTGIATFSAVMFTSGPQTAINLTATTTGLLTDNDDISNNFNISTFTYLAGDYRPLFDFVDFSINGSWETFDGSSWSTALLAPQNILPVGSRPNRIIIHLVGIEGAGNSSNTYKNIIILSGGELILPNAVNPTADFISSGNTLEVQSGGSLVVDGQINMNSSANLVVRAGGTLTLNNSSIGNSHGFWAGNENFEPGSTFTINNHRNDGAGSSSLINVYGQISDNSAGSKFGNLTINWSPTTTWTMVGGDIDLTLCQNLSITNPGTFPIVFFSNANTPSAIVTGNLTHNSGILGLTCVFSGTSTSQSLTINGNLTTNAGTLKLFHNGGGNAGGISVNLGGNLEVASGATVSNDGTVANCSFNFNGTSLQTINVTPTITGWRMFAKNLTPTTGASVALRNQSLTFGNSTTFTVEDKATFDFSFDGINGTGTNALDVLDAGTATSFIKSDGGVLKISNTAGITTSGATGNIQTDTRTITNIGRFVYQGKADQFTGNALPTTAPGSGDKGIEVNLGTSSVRLIPSAITNLANTDTLWIRQGVVDETATEYFQDGASSGNLRMTGGTYQIARLSATVPSITGEGSSYQLTAGTINLDGAGNQILRGARDYFNLSFSTSGTKTLTSALTAFSLNDLVTIQDAAILDVANNDFSGTSALNMTGTSRFRLSSLSTTLPQLTGTYTLTGGTIELYGTNTGQTHSLRGTVTYNNVELNSIGVTLGGFEQANVVAGAGFGLRGTMTVNSPTCFQLASTYTITDAGTSSFVLGAGSTLRYGGTIDASGATGNIQTDTRTFPTTASYGFVGTTTPQSVGTGLPASMVNLYMDKGLATNVVTLAGNTTITNQLVLGTGILDAVSNTVSVSNTATTAVTGASANSFVSGRLNRSLPAPLLTGTSYSFPVGKQSPITYLPATLVNPTTTGIGAVTITMEAFNTNSGGTPDPNSIGSLSTAEYWSLAATGNFNSSQFTLARPTLVTPLSSIARSTTTANGTYVFIGGTPSGSQIANSNFSAGNTQFLAFANPIAPPTITLVQGTSPAFAGQADYTGYVGQTLTITGTNFTSTANMSVSIGGLAATTFTVVNSTTITAVVAQAASGATVVVTNTITTGNASAAFTFLGWISDASTDWGTASTWLGGVVPPASVAVTIAHAVTANSAVANNPNTLTIRSASSLTFGASGTLTVNTTLTNGGSIVMTAGGTLTMANASTFANGTATFTGGTGTVVFAGTCTVTTTGGIPFNNVTINAAINLGASTSIAGTLRMNQGGSIITNALTYGAASTLSYNGTSSQTANVLEFPSASGPINFTANNSVNVSLPFSRTVIGNVRILSGDLRNSSGTGVTLTMSGVAATLEVTGALQGTDIGAGNDINLIISGTTTVSGSNVTTCKVLNATVNTGATLALARNNFEVRYGAFNINGTGTLRIDANGNVAAFDGNSRVPIYASTANLVYNSNTAYGRSVEWSTLSGPAGYPGNVTIQNGTTLNIGSPATDLGIVSNLTLGVTGSAGSLNMQATPQGITVGGNVTIGSDVNTSTLTLSTNASSPALRVAGNWNRNSFGSFVGTGANGRGVFFNGTGAQSLTANGGETFQFLLIQKTVGTNLTLNNAVTVNSALTLNSGRVVLGSNNLTAASQTGGSSTAYVVTDGSGRLALNVNNTDIQFPVGPTTSIYAPATLNQAGTSETIGVNVETAPAFADAVNSNSLMVNLEWSLNESTPGLNSLVTRFEWPLTSEAGSFNRAAGVYHGNFNSPNYQVRPASATTGAGPYVSTTTVNYTGNLSNQYFVVGNFNGIIGCASTTAAGIWNDDNTWASGSIPPSDVNVCINHNVTIGPLDPNPNPLIGLTINASGVLGMDIARTLTFSAIGGTIVNNSGATASLGAGTVVASGILSFSGANTTSINNLTLNGNTTITTPPTILGNLTLNPGAFLTAQLIYGPSSTLVYNTGGAYNVSNEWGGNSLTPGLGIPFNVTISGSALSLLTSSRGIGGSMNITSGSLTLSAIAGDIYIGGNWTRNSAAAFTSNSRAVFFNGSANQIISVSPSGTETFSYLFNSKTGGNLVLDNVNPTDVTVNAGSGSVIQLGAGTTIDLNGRTLALTGTGGNVGLSGGTVSIIGGANSVFAISNGTKTVSPAGGATLSFGSNVTVALSSGLNFGANTSTINGTLQIAFGGFVNTNAPFYATNSNLRYFSGSAYTRGTEWSATSGAGYPFNVTIDPNGTNTTLNMGSGASNQTIAGNLTINSGAVAPGAGLNMQAMTGFLGVSGNVVVNNAGALTLSTAFGGDIKVAGNFTRNTGGTLTQNNREVEMNGTALQTINGVNGFAYLAINNTGSTVQISANTTVSNRLRLTNGTLDLNSFSVTMSNGSEIYRTAATATMNALPTLTVGDVYDVRYAGTLTSGNEFSSNNTFVRDLIIESGALPTMGASRTVNRNVRLAGDLNLGTFTLTHRGRNATLGAAGSIEITSGNRNITGSAGSIYDIIGIGGNNPIEFTKQVTNPGSGTLTVGANVLMRIGDGRMDFGTGSPTTINGTLQVALGGSVNPNPCYYGVGSTLRFANTVDYQVPAADYTWAVGAIASGLPGIPWNVDINDVETDLQLQDTRALRNNLTITNGTFTLTPAYTGTFNIGGNWTRTNVLGNSAFTHNNKKVVFDRQSAGNQTITVGGTIANPLTTETFYDLEVSTLTGDVQLGTSSNVNIVNNLNFVNGRFNLNGVNNLIIGNSSANGTITGFGTGRYVISNGGNLRRFTNTNATYDFPVGDNSTYSPAQLVLTNGGQANAYIDSKVVNGMHPNMTAPVPTRYIARYWSVEPTGLAASPLYNINYTYSAADEVGTGVMYPVKYSTTNPVPGWFSCPGSSAVAITGTSGADDNVLKTFSWSGLTTFSDFSGAGNGSPLPVELLSFNAVPVNNAEVLVTWTTASEINNDKFIVERSLDAVNFEIVGTVNGAGNSNFMRNYSLNDVKPYNGVSYYRLRQVDFNGDQEIFTPVAVYLTGAAGSSMNVYPNPATETATLSINGQYKGKAVLQIIDITGRNISKQQINLTEGSNAIKLDVDGLANGKYLIHVTLSDGTRMNMPLIISK